MRIEKLIGAFKEHVKSISAPSSEEKPEQSLQSGVIQKIEEYRPGVKTFPAPVTKEVFEHVMQEAGLSNYYVEYDLSHAPSTRKEIRVDGVNLLYTSVDLGMGRCNTEKITYQTEQEAMGAALELMRKCQCDFGESKHSEEDPMQSKLISPGRPDLVWIETDEKCEVAAAFQLDDIEVSFQERADKKLEVYIQAEYSKVRYVKLRWQRPAPQKVQILGDTWERGYGDLEWTGLSSRRTMPWYFLAANDEKIFGYGVMVRPSAMCYWQMDTQGITLVLDVRCGGRGTALNGRKLHAATALVMEADRDRTTFRAAQDFCRFMCTDPLLPGQPVYGSNNWYYAYGMSSEEEILADTDYLMKLTDGAANPPYMVIDDGWQEYRTPDYIGGPWKRGNERFPDLKHLAEQIRAKGAVPGIWVRFLQNRDPAIPDAWRFEETGDGRIKCPDRPENILDPSVPEVLEYIKEDIRRISGEWGYRLIKHDFSTYDIFGRWGMEMKPSVTVDGWKFRDDTRTSAEIIKDMYRAICEAAGETDAVIIGCNTIGHLGAGLMHVNRTGDDTSGLHWERTRQMGINTLAFRLPQHKAFYDVDADCVGITGQVPWFYNRQWADVIAGSGTPLFVSAKPSVLSEEQQEELHRIMLKASRQDCHNIPLDWEDNDTPEIWGNPAAEDPAEPNHYTWYRPQDDIPRSRDAKYCIQLPL